MKLIKTISAIGCAVAVLVSVALAENGAEKKQTCCEKAKAAGKECKHKCCVEAKKDGKTCEKCNPNKEDMKKDEKTDEKKADSK